MRVAPSPRLQPPPAGRARRCCATVSLSLAALLAGCAAPGEPVPRRPAVPEPVSDLAARQQGDSVVLTFTLPRRSMRGEPLAQTPAVEIYRDIVASAAPRNGTPLPLVATVPADLVPDHQQDGRVELRDEPPPASPGATVIYRVRTRVSHRSVSADSNTALLRLHPPPEAPRDLRATLTEDAVILSWSGSASSTVETPAYRVYRAELPVGSSGEGPLPTAPDGLQAPLSLVAETAASEYRDMDFAFGRTYLYTVRRVLRYPPDIVESDDTNVVLITARDVFSPAAPQHLQAVIVPAAGGEPASVDLVWAIGAENDLAGYLVYRSERPGDPGERLTQEPRPAPVFRDTAVAVGRRYFYRVRAVDRAGNESPWSDAVEAELPQGPL